MSMEEEIKKIIENKEITKNEKNINIKYRNNAKMNLF